MNRNYIEVYAKQQGAFSNIDYYIVNTFDDIDEQPLVEGLSNYFYSNDKSFTGIYIKPENIERFNRIKDWAIEYYDEI